MKKEKENSRKATHKLVLAFLYKNYLKSEYSTKEKRFRVHQRETAKLYNPIIKALFFSLIIFFSSCATILGGQKTDHQRHKPDCDEPKRQIRIGMFIADCIFFPPGLIIDFSTKKIYKKFPNEKKVKKCKGGSE